MNKIIAKIKNIKEIPEKEIPFIKNLVKNEEVISYPTKLYCSALCMESESLGLLLSWHGLN